MRRHNNLLNSSLNIFILHRLRKKFLQLILISLDFASWELHQYSCRMCGPMKNPKVETRSRDSNSGPHECKADALPHDHGHHNSTNLYGIACRTSLYKNPFLPSVVDEWNLLPQNMRYLEPVSSFKDYLNIDKPIPNKLFLVGKRRFQIIHARLRN